MFKLSWNDDDIDNNNNNNDDDDGYGVDMVNDWCLYHWYRVFFHC